MNTKRYLLCELGEKMILLGKQGESGALRIEFDCAPWIEEYPTATIKLFVFNKAHRQDDPILPVLGSEGTLRVWIVGEDETATSGHGVIELVLQDADTGTTLKSATGYTTVVKSPSAGIEAREAQAGYVRYDIDQSEILTEEQKTIARNNIGAGTGNGTGGGIAVETDPTVPDWAKQKTKPTYTAAEVSADPAGTAAKAIDQHDVDDEAHEDIRALIVGLTNRLNALADSDDTTLDQLSELVAYIKNNKALIDQITTGKISTSDIVDNLTTNVSTKVLSAAQGVALKALIDAIVVPSTLPNPQPLNINGQTYDGSKAVTMTIQATEGGSDVAIDTTLTQSGQAADAAVVGEKLNELNEAINAKGDPTDEQVAAAVNAYLAENPVSGLSKTASNLLITILRSGVYTDDQSDNITALETALGAGGETPDEPDVPPAVTTYTISNELINCTSSNSATSVEADAAYTATLTANDGYTLTGGMVTVTMGGEDITDTAYADGVITIEAVTGNVEIIASAVIVESEAALPEGGLMAYFDLRNAPTDQKVGTTTGIPTATKGTGALFSWASQAITSSDDYGAVLPRALVFSAEGTTTQTNLGTEFTFVILSRNGVPSGASGDNGIMYTVVSPKWAFVSKYNTESGTKQTNSLGSGNMDRSGDYNFLVNRVNGMTQKVIFDTSTVERNGSDYDDFVSWYSYPVIGNTYNDGTAVACAIYDRMLSDSEVEACREFMKTLEVAE